jgi:two-component system response regulator AtoC
VIEVTGPDGSIKTLEQVELELIAYAYGRCAGNITKTARVLGVGRATIYRKLPAARVA